MGISLWSLNIFVYFYFIEYPIKAYLPKAIRKLIYFITLIGNLFINFLSFYYFLSLFLDFIKYFRIDWNLCFVLFLYNTCLVCTRVSLVLMIPPANLMWFLNIEILDNSMNRISLWCIPRILWTKCWRGVYFWGWRFTVSQSLENQFMQ